MNNQAFERSAGLLLGISSLSSTYGIGGLGKAAFEFVDFLKDSGQSYWQVLPIGPTGYGDSPYQSCSAFAGNPYYIDLDILIEKEFLNRAYVEEHSKDEETVDYEYLFLHRVQILYTAFEEFQKKLKDQSNKLLKHKYEIFLQESSFWIEDYSLYMALKETFFYVSWNQWEENIKRRKSESLLYYKEKLQEKIGFWKFCQFEFFLQWEELKNYANKKGIEIIGDLPIYIALDSADVWASPEIFELDSDLVPTQVAGVPPDAFSTTGQKWGNPLYNWEKIRSTDYLWWKKRVEKAGQLYDVIRIDHFIGLAKYYGIPRDSIDATQGVYRIGPGEEITQVMNSILGENRIIAENLGVYIEEAEQLLKVNQYPVMQVLEFCFDGLKDNPHLPFYYNKNSVAYGGTHDNETLMGYFQDRPDHELTYVYKLLNTKDKIEMVDESIRMLYASVANIVILQVQDILRLGNESRMNYPSTLGNNWRWRLKRGQLEKMHKEYLRELSEIYWRKK